MLKRAQSIAKKESRTISELIREALRYYESRPWWEEEVNIYGRATAQRREIREGDVERLVHETRVRRRAPKK